MAQPNKGDRQQVSARISREHYNKMSQYVVLRGISKNDFIHDLIVEALAQINLDAVNKDQTELPMTG